MTIVRDVTDQVRVGYSDEESLPMEKCVCGASWPTWDGPILHIERDDPVECPKCGRKFHWKSKITVWEVSDVRPATG